MEDILKEVKLYDPKTLREKLLEHGIKVGPIAPATISLFQKRLANELGRIRGVKQGDLTDTTNKVIDEKVYITENQQNVDLTAEKLVAVPDVYYAVCLPGNVEPEGDSSVEQLVFSDKDLALKIAKKYKGSRFKVFKTEHDAKSFSRLTAESALPSPCRPSQEDSTQDSLPSGESSPFKAPKPQELAQLRKIVEKGDAEAFKRQVWENPRFLVGSGDTPAIFQEGPRYTAMHVAAMKNKPELCQAILDILEDPAFVNKLYPQTKHTEETQNSRINFLVDLYLNMPDKGNCESPLHMACKYGHVEVVKVLVAHPRTDKMLKNKYGDTPKDLICSRCTTSSASVKKKIEDLLQGHCYVPLMRFEDNTAPPVVGHPWSPDVNNTSLDIPVITNSPRDPAMSVKACAGPMSPTEASAFHKRWTTPPSQSPEVTRAYFHTKRSDSEKGMERIGRQLAQEMQIPWSEYWEFLDQFIDMSSPAGLDLLEHYLKKRVWLNLIKNFKEKHGITEEIVDNTSFITPFSNRLRQTDLNESFEGDIFQSKLDSKEISSKAKVEKSQSENECEIKPSSNINLEEDSGSIVSPVTNLSQTFAKMKLDESWSDRATVDSSDKVISDSGTDKTESEINNGKSVLGIERLNSAGSDSTTSYTTAVENTDDSSLSDFASAPSSVEPEKRRVCFLIKDGAILKQLVHEVKSRKNLCRVGKSEVTVNFIVQVKQSGSLLTVVSIPDKESVLEIVLLEDVEVVTYDGDLSKVEDGSVVEITAQDVGNGDESAVVLGYLTRTHVMPKSGYIYGPQPTREDLNVSRALGDVTISPECHPNVFHWKINLSRFLRDTNYRWQSPAKLKTRIRQASPVPSPLGKTSPVIPYGSPLGARNQPSGPVTSDIRTRLFPSILE